jgi:cysteine synthase A
MGTGPEIWRQTNGTVAAFVSGAGIYYSSVHNSTRKLSKFLKPGTGGTVAGTGQYLKSMDPDVFVAIADPEGSGLYNKVICYFLSKAGFWSSQ